MHGDYFFVSDGNDGQEQLQKMNDLFQVFQVSVSPSPLSLQVNFKRTITVSAKDHNCHDAHPELPKIARFTFNSLCTTDLYHSDYQTLASHFDVLMVYDIPYLSLEHPDRARRFITLVDELYEGKCCLVCGAVDVPDRLFIGAAGDEDVDKGMDKCISNGSKGGVEEVKDDEPSGNMLAVDAAQIHGTSLGQLASVKELSFAFKRAASRLLEMCSESWWEENGVVVSVKQEKWERQEKEEI